MAFDWCSRLHGAEEETGRSVRLPEAARPLWRWSGDDGRDPVGRGGPVHARCGICY